MNHATSRPNLRLVIPERKDVDTDLHPDSDNSSLLKGKSFGGSLSPNLTPASPPTLLFPSEVLKIGKYYLISRTDTLQLQCGLSVDLYKARHQETGEECVCKVVPATKYREILSAYWSMGAHEHINDILEVIVGETQAYVFFPRHYGDLHSFIRNKRKLRETEACRLFLQVASAVAHCHSNGVVLRDLKLRKFVFKDPERTQLKLESLEDACVLCDEDDDSLTDKHGCPAYVSPEILTTTEKYSGKSADMWSLGVILYTMLIGRYPFQDSDAGALFTKIRRGIYTVPDSISSRARCLVRSLLRMDPYDRLSADDMLQHPWFSLTRKPFNSSSLRTDCEKDQTVPDFVSQHSDFEFT